MELVISFAKRVRSFCRRGFSCVHSDSTDIFVNEAQLLCYVVMYLLEELCIVHMNQWENIKVDIN
jgi:hypothetical protein